MRDHGMYCTYLTDYKNSKIFYHSEIPCKSVNLNYKWI